MQVVGIMETWLTTSSGEMTHVQRQHKVRYNVGELSLMFKEEVVHREFKAKINIESSAKCSPPGRAKDLGLLSNAHGDLQILRILTDSR